MTEAQEILARACARAESRTVAAPQRVDYVALNSMVRRQRSTLTRAKNSGNADNVVVACSNAVREWNQPGSMWPDDWSRWQSALDEVLPWPHALRLEDLS